LRKASAESRLKSLFYSLVTSKGGVHKILKSDLIEAVMEKDLEEEEEEEDI
jgi:hypothetical protein